MSAARRKAPSDRRVPSGRITRPKRATTTSATAGDSEPAPSVERLFDFAPIMTVLLDSVGIVLDVNGAGVSMLGLTRRRLLGMPLRTWMAPVSRLHFLEHVRRARAGHSVVESQVTLRAADGGTVQARLYTRRSRYRQQTVFPTVIVDLTEYAMLERRREDAERQRDEARAAEAAKDRLIAMVSHELRNPLSPALVAADGLLSGKDMPDVVRQLAAVIKRNIQLEARLIDDLLDVARISRGQLDLEVAATDLHDAIAEAVNVCAPAAAAKEIHVSLEFQARQHVAMADGVRMRQVFWNLLTNAIKFTDRGGTIVVRTINIAANRIVVSVRDYGIGMDPATRQGLFEPFHRRAPDARGHGGLGLGLSICRSIVDGHGGRIWGESAGPGQGATFHVELETTDRPHEIEPGAPEPAVSEQEADGQTVPSPGRRRALVIEDHQDTGTLLSMFLDRHEFDVTLAPSVADGLRHLTESTWDAVISDLALGDGSGLDIARQARRLTPPPPRLIAVSGYGAPADIEKSRDAGFDEHLVKPIDLDRLLLLLPPSPTP